jgi:hypothetical protein
MMRIDFHRAPDYRRGISRRHKYFGFWQQKEGWKLGRLSLS